jgi:transposase
LRRCVAADRKEITDTPDYVSGRFKVIRHSARSCRAGPATRSWRRPRLITRLPAATPSAALLAHIVVSKYDDHLPVYRQAEIFAREGVKLGTSTFSSCVGATAAALNPLIDALAAEVMASDTLHVDDTPVPVLAPGTGKTKTGRLWTYNCRRPPTTALFFYWPDRKGEYPQGHKGVPRDDPRGETRRKL